MCIVDPILAELAHENVATRKVLDRVPDEHLDWRPHPKSMTMRTLASHIADIPCWLTEVILREELVLDAGSRQPTYYDSQAAILKAFDQNVAIAQRELVGRSDDHLTATWRLTDGTHTLLEMPRVAAIRGLIMNHSVHHRGQLTVYLRLKNVPLPPVFGPTADEDP